ncbi:MAG: aminoacyl-histidine dipeptidase [Clostridia bacterium]|nr:aminoacyl-histidine dipeptidase [Clostridia bacterium]
MTKSLPQPQSVFKYFYEVSKIPRSSGNTKAVSDYCVQFAKEQSLWYKQDKFNNIIIKKPAYEGYEGKPPVIIQGHLDMVCEKTSQTKIDFEKDGLNLLIDGDMIYADGTTLGADDGIAVAYALALLESKDIPAPPLEVILTTDEETGMDGAINLDFSCIEGRILLNIDSENEGVFTVSCAGGLCCDGNIYCKSNIVNADGFEIKIQGLAGGHSGVEIDKGRANANKVAGELLSALLKIPGVRLSKINGGKKHNAIPNECELTIAFSDNENSVTEQIEKFRSEQKIKFQFTDPGFNISYNKFTDRTIKVFDADSGNRTAEFLSIVSDGVKSMSTDIDGLVETSSNLGIVKTNEDNIYFLSSVRSSEDSQSKALGEDICNLAEKCGGKASVSGSYPAWEYRKKSHLRSVMCDVYKRQYGKEPVIEAIHAGLECGIFCGKADNLDCVSFGPDIFDIHTVNERMSISSVQRVWKFIKSVLISL